MYILAQTNSLEDNNDTIYMVQAPKLEEEYQKAGYQRHERSYKLEYQRKEYTVLCPEYRNDNISASPIVIVPVFLIPRRPYPVCVYLYSLDLYSSNPVMGQREAAEKTRELFGLKHFAHTTLGRALKVFVRNVEGATVTSGEYRDDGVQETGNNDVVQHASDAKYSYQENDAIKQSCFPTTQATATWRNQAARFLEGKVSSSFTILKQFIETCFELAKEWNMGCRRFLL